MAIRSQTFAIITIRLIVICWKKLNIPTKYEENRTKPGNPYYLVLFENRTKPGTVLSETVLSVDPLYCEKQAEQLVKICFGRARAPHYVSTTANTAAALFYIPQSPGKTALQPNVKSQILFHKKAHDVGLQDG